MTAHVKNQYPHLSPAAIDREFTAQLGISTAITGRKPSRLLPMGKQVEGGYVGRLSGQPKKGVK